MSGLTQEEKIARDMGQQRDRLRDKLRRENAFEGLTMEQQTQVLEAAYAKANLQWESMDQFLAAEAADVKVKQEADLAAYQAMHKPLDSLYHGQ